MLTGLKLLISWMLCYARRVSSQFEDVNVRTVYFMQHGIAVSKDENEERPLSIIGSEEVRNMARYLKGHQVVIHKICHSGKLRARQTAALISEILEIEDVAELAGMNPNDSSSRIIDQITEDAMMFVGHLPNIQNVVATLVSGDASNTIIKFKNAGIVCLEIEGQTGNIKWFVTPDIC